ncbi:MAG TPA: DUF1579 family protein [Gemmatimonadaceae bacterium]|nr:DUF1579 family protein [Gemmatimonadaceae bacterium]
MAPPPEMAALAAFVGTWRTEGEIVDGRGAPVARLLATDRYEWLGGGRFLVHHVDGRMGDEPVQALEVIGWDAERRRYQTQAFDAAGATRWEAMLAQGRWTIQGETERFTGTFTADGRALDGTWEQRGEDGAWRRWMTLRLTRAD